MAKGDQFYYDNFAECSALAKKAANYLVECFESYDPDCIETMIEKMHSFEHSADLKKHEMNRALTKAFVTPVDREDLQKLYVYNIRTIEPAAVEYAKYLVKGCDLVYEIMAEFENFKKSKKLHDLIVACNDVEEECDKLYLTTLRELTKNSTDVLTTISWYKVYDCLEACADACEHVSECVESIVMKNT